MYLPRFRGRPTPFTSRVYLSTQDWLKFSSYKERALGLSLGLIASKYHELAYNIAWRNLIDPSQMASRSIRRQLGHNLVSALKYTFKFDQRNSSLRPTRGYSFISTSQIGGLAPDSRTLRFLRQVWDSSFLCQNLHKPIYYSVESCSTNILLRKLPWHLVPRLCFCTIYP